MQTQRDLRKILGAFEKKGSFWWTTGRLMVERGWTGADAVSALEAGGKVVHVSDQYLWVMRYVVEAIQENHLPRRAARECPISFLRPMLRHFRQGRISRDDAEALITARARHIGAPRFLKSSDMDTIEGVRRALRHIDHPSQ